MSQRASAMNGSFASVGLLQGQGWLEQKLVNIARPAVYRELQFIAVTRSQPIDTNTWGSGGKGSTHCLPLQ